MIRERPIETACLALLLAGAAGGLGWQAWRSFAAPLDLTATASTAQSDAPIETVVIDPLGPPTRLVEFQGVADRPLFRAGRRKDVPPPPEPAPAPEPQTAPPEPVAVDVVPQPAPPPEPVPEFRLTGILFRDGGGRALIQGGSDQPSRWVGPGDEVAGWRVSRITPAGVTLKEGQRQVRIDLRPAAVPPL